jgi:hypothetical protein
MGRGAYEVEFQPSLQGGLYGSSKRQDQEESACEEESRWQEKGQVRPLIEAIH